MIKKQKKKKNNTHWLGWGLSEPACECSALDRRHLLTASSLTQPFARLAGKSRNNHVYWCD